MAQLTSPPDRFGAACDTVLWNCQVQSMLSHCSVKYLSWAFTLHRHKGIHHWTCWVYTSLPASDPRMRVMVGWRTLWWTKWCCSDGERRGFKDGKEGYVILTDSPHIQKGVAVDRRLWMASVVWAIHGVLWYYGRKLREGQILEGHHSEPAELGCSWDTQWQC